ncbi:hypothetical protein H4Q26_004923 [Puccinia striiformis f. sp. tritici PST-130]|nr:hypothetical protein H4Q26_004923 [Puccinia striiformis f. sp. tritici PST-130]
MANSQESGLVDSFNSLGTDDSPQQIKHYEGLVARELGRVHGAYVNLFAGIVNPASLAVYNQLDIRQELWDQLQSNVYLP